MKTFEQDENIQYSFVSELIDKILHSVNSVKVLIQESSGRFKNKGKTSLARAHDSVRRIPQTANDHAHVADATLQSSCFENMFVLLLLFLFLSLPISHLHLKFPCQVGDRAHATSARAGKTGKVTVVLEPSNTKLDSFASLPIQPSTKK